MTEIERAIEDILEVERNTDNLRESTVKLATEALREKREREKGCHICNADSNDFAHLNGNTADYSGILFSFNRQGMLRARHYLKVYGGFDSQEVLNCKCCPNCGRKLVKD